MGDGTLKVRGPATAKKYKRREVCRVYGANRATVDLICAAPDMLAACKSAAQLLFKLGSKNHDPEYSELLAAIAKAGGK